MSKRKQEPNLADLCYLVNKMRGLKKDDPVYQENHKKAVELVDFLNKEYYEGYCSLSLAREINAIQHERNKVKINKV